MPILFEYLIALNILNTLNVLNNRKILNNLKLLFRTVNDGKIEIKSTIAIGVSGYWQNESFPFFNLKSAVINLSK